MHIKIVLNEIAVWGADTEIQTFPSDLKESLIDTMTS